MRLVEALAAAHPAYQRGRGVDHEAAEKDEPAPEDLGGGLGAPQREHAKNDADEPAPGVAHEDFRGWKVPGQESGNAARQCDRDEPVLRGSCQPPAQRAAQACRDGFYAGDAVDAVHEVVEVDHPDDVRGSQRNAEPAEIDRHAENRHRRNGTDTPKTPHRRCEVGKKAPASGQRAMVVEKSGHSDQQPASEKRATQRWRQAGSPSQPGCENNERHDDRDPAAARSCRRMRTAPARLVEQPPRCKRIASHSGSDEPCRGKCEERSKGLQAFARDHVAVTRQVCRRVLAERDKSSSSLTWKARATEEPITDPCISMSRSSIENRIVNPCARPGGSQNRCS